MTRHHSDHTADSESESSNSEQEPLKSAVEEQDNKSSEQQALESKIEKFYNRIPKLIAHIYKGNEERHNALDSLLATFSKINELESRLNSQAPGDNPPLSLSRIYELAVSGGGEADIEELKEVNQQFAQENEILVQTIKSLNFKIRRLESEGVDSLIKDGEITGDLNKDIQNSSSQIRNIIDDIENRLFFLSGQVVNDDEKPLHERFVEELSGLDDITADVLKSVPRKATMFGRLLRRVGLGYDARDEQAARDLVKIVLKTNHEMNQVLESLKPAQEQLDKLAEISRMLSIASTHDIRETEEYKDALQEIDRLGAYLERMESEHGTLEELEATRQKTQDELNELNNKKSVFSEEISSLNHQINALSEEISSLNHELNALRTEYSTLEADHPDKLRAIIEEKQAEIDEFRQESERKLNEVQEENNKPAQENKSGLDKVQERYDELEKELKALQKYIRQIEDGLLVEKLEVEILSLRESVQRYERQAEEEKEKRQAFEERVGQWVDDSDKLKSDIQKWQKRAGIKWSQFAMAGAGLGLAGYSAGSFLHQIPAPIYLGLGIGVPAVLGIFIGFAHSRDRFEDPFGYMINMSLAGITGAGLGLVLTATYSPANFKYGHMVANFNSEFVEKFNDGFTQLCHSTQDCTVSVGKDGNKQISLTLENGQKALFDFADASKDPVITLSDEKPGDEAQSSEMASAQEEKPVSTPSPTG